MYNFSAHFLSTEKSVRKHHMLLCRRVWFFRTLPNHLIHYSSPTWNLWSKARRGSALSVSHLLCYHSRENKKNSWFEINLKLTHSTSVTDKSFRTLDVFQKHQRFSLSHSLMWDSKLSFLRVYNYCYKVEYWLAGTVHHCMGFSLHYPSSYICDC